MRGQTSLEILYQQSQATGGETNESAVLHDPTREKAFALGEPENGSTLDGLPSSVKSQTLQGKTYFPNLPPHLAERLFFDPNRGAFGALVFKGQFVDAALGDKYIQLNVLGQSELAELRALCLDEDPRKQDWDAAIDGLEASGIRAVFGHGSGDVWVTGNDGTVLQVENPSKMPDQGRIREIREPIVTVHLYMPQDYVGPVMTLANLKRGNQINMAYHGRQVMLTYEMPLAEIVLDFFDKLKSVSRGYASMDYEFKEYRGADVVKVDILLNGDKVDALSIIVHRSQSLYRSRAVVTKMRELISRQMYDVAVQAAIGANIIARETIKALRKNVLAKCYGGDITRKRKLLEKQKAGKKRMKQIGSVEVPQEAFLAILQVDD